jgi:type I restriction enzyme S subunit
MVKQTDAGEIPADWDAVPIGSVCTVVRGGSPRPAGDPRFFGGSFIPWLTVASLTNIPECQLVVGETATCLTEEGAKRSRTLAPGTPIIANSGATLGVAKILGITCCANDGIAALLAVRKDVREHYVVHYVNTQTRRLRDVVATGNGQPNLNTGLIRSIWLPLPPTYQEQAAIAQALSDADALIESLDQLLAKKRQIKQGAIQELLTGQRRLPGFSGQWTGKALGELFSFSGGHSASRDQLGFNGTCYLHYGDIHTSTKTYVVLPAERDSIPKLDIPLKEVNSAALLEDGDVVFVDASEDDEGTSKHVVISNPERIPFIAGLHTIVAKGKTDELVPAYRRHCFQAAAIKAQFRFFAVGTKVSGVSKSNIRKIMILAPSPEEQAAIAATLSDMDAEITTLEARLTKARALKQGMAQALLTGRIRLI